VTSGESARKELNHQFEFAEFPLCGADIDAAGSPSYENAGRLPPSRRRFSGSWLAAPKWDALPVGKRPESGLLDLRKGLGLYVNVRPLSCSSR